MKKTWGYLVVILFCIGIYWHFWGKGLIPAPFDTLVGAYYPWLSYKWGNVVGVPVKNALLSDSFSTFYIWKYLAIDQLRQFKLPVWNQYVFAGTPLLATFHSAVLFPGNILLFLPKPWSWGIYIFSSTLAAAISMYLMLGRWTRNVWARIWGAIVFATAGPMTTWAEFGTGVWAMACWPILFLLPTLTSVSPPSPPLKISPMAHGFAVRGGLKKLYGVAISLLITAMILAGNVQIVTYAIPLLILWLIFIKANKKYYWYLGLGILISAIQLLPTYNFYKISIRGEENYAAGFNYGLTPIKELIRFWAADFFGNPTTGNHWDKAVSYHEFSSFMGTITVMVILTFIILGRKNNKIEMFWIIIFSGSLILLIDNPLSHLIFSLPLPLLTYSSASRLLFVTIFAGSILLASAYKYIDKLIPLALILTILTLFEIYLVPEQSRNISIKNSILPIGLILLAVVIGKFKKFGLVILVLLSMWDMSRYFGKYNPFVPETYTFPETPIITYLKNNLGQARFFRQKTNLLPLNSWTPYKLRSVEGYDPLHYLSYHQEFHLLNNQPRSNPVSRYAELEDINLSLIDKYSLKYYVGVDETYDPILRKLLNAGWKKVFIDNPVAIYENPDKLPPATDKTGMPKDILIGAVITIMAMTGLIL